MGSLLMVPADDVSVVIFDGSVFMLRVSFEFGVGSIVVFGVMFVYYVVPYIVVFVLYVVVFVVDVVF